MSNRFKDNQTLKLWLQAEEGPVKTEFDDTYNPEVDASDPLAGAFGDGFRVAKPKEVGKNVWELQSWNIIVSQGSTEMRPLLIKTLVLSKIESVLAVRSSYDNVSEFWLKNIKKPTLFILSPPCAEPCGILLSGSMEFRRSRNLRPDTTPVTNSDPDGGWGSNSWHIAQSAHRPDLQ